MEKLTKLILNRETIANLNESDLSFVQGGGGVAQVAATTDTNTETRGTTANPASYPNGSCNC